MKLKRVCAVFFALSVLGLVGETAIAISTLLPNAPVLPRTAPFVLFPGVFVLHIWTVVLLWPVMRRRRGWLRGPRLREFAAAVGAPLPAFAAFWVYFIVIWVLSMLTLVAIHGGVRSIAGHYYLTNHGTLTPVSRATYVHVQVLGQRASHSSGASSMHSDR